MAVLTWILANYAAVLHGVIALLGALIAIFLIIPGPHPEDWFQKAADFLEKFSAK
jgi:hypothetical protein